MTDTPHTLAYIGNDNNTYVTGRDGNNPAQYANKKTVTIGNKLGLAPLGNRDFVEPNALKLYKTCEKAYYVWDVNNREYVVDSNSSRLSGIPMYLEGWKNSEGDVVSPSQNVDSEFIRENFSNGNMNLFAKWETPYLIRVIVFVDNVPVGAQDTGIQYNAAISSPYSYTVSQDYPLVNGYKNIEQSTNYYFINNYTNNNPIQLEEFGVGESGDTDNGCGCPYGRKYFAVKKGIASSATITLTPDSNFTNGSIPLYILDGDKVEYKCYVAEQLVCRTIKIEDFIEEPMTFDNGSWVIGNANGSKLSGIDGDRTVFVRLVPKLEVTFGEFGRGGSVTGDGLFLPGESCTLNATPDTNYYFDYWEIDGRQYRDAQYTFPVYTNVMVIPHFEHYTT